MCRKPMATDKRDNKTALKSHFLFENKKKINQGKFIFQRREGFREIRGEIQYT